MEKVLTEALTFDDVLVLPMHSNILPKEVSLKSKFTKNDPFPLHFCKRCVTNEISALINSRTIKFRS